MDFFFVFVFLLIGCKPNNVIKQDFEEKVPGVIDSLGIRHLYNEYKWRYYCFYCDKVIEDSFSSQFNVDKGVTFGMVDLENIYLEVANDTIIYGFSFALRDSNRYSVNSYMNLISNVCLLKSTGEFIGFPYDKIGCTKIYFSEHYKDVEPTVLKEYIEKEMRFMNPLRNEVVEYIIENEEQLAPWFRNEAIKRGVLIKDLIQIDEKFNIPPQFDNG